MGDAQSKAMELLRLKDDEYFALDDKALQSLQLKLADLLEPDPFAKPPGRQMDSPEAVLAIGAPSRIASVHVSGIPVVTAVRLSEQREWEMNYRQNRTFVVVDLLTGYVKAGFPMPHERVAPAPPSKSGAAPDPNSATSSFTGVDKEDLAKLLDGILGPTRLAVTALYHDWRSNTVQIEIAGNGRRTPPVARRTDIAQSANVTGRFPVDAPRNLNFAISGGTGSNSLIVRVAANVPVSATPLISSAARPLLPVTALLTRLDQPNPVQVDLAVPATLAGSGSNQMAQALFTFDLRKALVRPLPVGTYHLYLVVGAMLEGPRVLSVTQ
jgi:hypothetical protein